MLAGTLLRCYDQRYQHLAELTRPSCENLGLELVEVVKNVEGPFPYLTRANETLRLFGEGHHEIIYADVDVLFNPKGREAKLPLSDKPFLLSCDSAGLCTGFMVMRRTPEMVRLLVAWANLGSADETGPHFFHDQTTLKLMAGNFQWVRDLIKFIPTTLVSNPECAGKPGKLAHHFWANGGPEYLANLATSCESSDAFRLACNLAKTWSNLEGLGHRMSRSNISLSRLKCFSAAL